ncbi:hypothetical protein [Synechococcus sp. MIT S1220]|uniref:hypothetical protein n=1 Tax=Synechococcus sp. MIT S1220 TaxID=3082549 RepID=UPI0039AF6F0E
MKENALDGAAAVAVLLNPHEPGALPSPLTFLPRLNARSRMKSVNHQVGTSVPNTRTGAIKGSSRSSEISPMGWIALGMLQLWNEQVRISDNKQQASGISLVFGKARDDQHHTSV